MGLADGALATIHDDGVSPFSDHHSWGDADGDGFDDLFVGNSYSASRADSVGHFLGPLAGEYDGCDPDTLVFGHTAYQHIGYSMSSGREVNGDGFADIAVGAPKSYLDPAGSERMGGALLWFSPRPTGTVPREDADILLLGGSR